MAELKTSLEWQKICKITVLDPDGWDRTNFPYSWEKEKITRQEFEKRLCSSTVKGTAQAIVSGKIWLDEKPTIKPSSDFGRLRKLVSDYIDFVNSDEFCEDNDFRQYIFEEAVEMFYGESIWDWVRSKRG